MKRAVLIAIAVLATLGATPAAARPLRVHGRTISLTFTSPVGAIRAVLRVILNPGNYQLGGIACARDAVAAGYRRSTPARCRC